MTALPDGIQFNPVCSSKQSQAYLFVICSNKRLQAVQTYVARIEFFKGEGKGEVTSSLCKLNIIFNAWPITLLN